MGEIYRLKFKVSRIQMDGAGRRTLVNLLFPKFFPCAPIQAIDHPVMHILRGLGPFATEIKPLLRRFHFAISDHGCDENLVAPNDRG